MKRAKFSKVLAFFLAAVMIFSALPLMAFASDEAATYTVSYGAPAIPMNEMTVVNLADISVEMERGTVVSGADITWAAAEQDGIEFDAAAKTVFAKPYH
jgi:Flp pilus assembly protein CpaB